MIKDNLDTFLEVSGELHLQGMEKQKTKPHLTIMNTIVKKAVLCFMDRQALTLTSVKSSLARYHK